MDYNRYYVIGMVVSRITIIDHCLLIDLRIHLIDLFNNREREMEKSTDMAERATHAAHK